MRQRKMHMGELTSICCGFLQHRQEFASSQPARADTELLAGYMY
jgi:hypothetical protein